MPGLKLHSFRCGRRHVRSLQKHCFWLEINRIGKKARAFGEHTPPTMLFCYYILAKEPDKINSDYKQFYILGIVQYVHFSTEW